MSGSAQPSPGQPNRWPLLVAVLPGLAAVLVLVEAIHAGERQALKADARRAAGGLAGALVAALGESSPPAARGESLA
ncbi:MAG: hypothetical protein JNK22_18305, partial [Rhodocyclaceae bacterium]|nr:hypothetical protein [Rhodocyclaceae bacterium]